MMSQTAVLSFFLSAKANLARPTITYAMHVSREPQDDGYTLIPSPEMNLPVISDLDFSLTLESSSNPDIPKRTMIPKQVRSQRLIIYEIIHKQVSYV